MISIANNFFKRIPECDKEFIVKKLSQFTDSILEVHGQIKSMPNGFWIRRINNTDVYKFRLNNSDRVLFVFNSNDESDKISITYLSYETHDKQIINGKAMNVISRVDTATDFDISSSYEDNSLEDQDDMKIIQDFYMNEDALSVILVDDLTLTKIIENESHYLSNKMSEEQFECLRNNNKPKIVAGGAGCGKTQVTYQMINKLASKGLNIAYITYSEYLASKAKTLFESENKEFLGHIDFTNLYDLLCRQLNIDKSSIVKYSTFKKWYEESNYKFPKCQQISPYLAWSEVKGILKGFMGLEFLNKDKLNSIKQDLMLLEDYKALSINYSSLEKENREEFYKLALSYNKWLKSNDLLDGCDLSKRKMNLLTNSDRYDYIVIDEVQDFSEVEIYIMSQMVKTPQNILFCGDSHQTIYPNFFKFSRIKSMYYKQDLILDENILLKNYRNSKEVVSLLNILIHEKNKLIPKDTYDLDLSPIKDGLMPKVIMPNEDNQSYFLDLIKDKHYAAIIVADDKTKETLIKLNEGASGRIFTLNEVKGLEYDDVICYNIFSDLFSKLDKYNNKAQIEYVYNGLYIAISRTVKILYFYEDMNTDRIRSIIGDYDVIKDLKNYRPFLFKTSSKEDWDEEAWRLKKNDLIDKFNIARDLSKEKAIKSLNQRVDDLYQSKEREKPFNPYTDVNEVESYIKEGFYNFQFYRFTEAINYFEVALEMAPERPDLYWLLGFTYGYMVDGREEAYKYFDLALKLDTNFYIAYLDKASVQVSLKQYEESIETLLTAIENCPEYGKAHYMLAGIYEQQGELDKALIEYNLSIKGDSFYFDSNNRVWFRVNKKDKRFLKELELINDKIVELKNKMNDPKSELKNLLRKMFAKIEDEYSQDKIFLKLENAITYTMKTNRDYLRQLVIDDGYQEESTLGIMSIVEGYLNDHAIGNEKSMIKRIVSVEIKLKTQSDKWLPGYMTNCQIRNDSENIMAFICSHVKSQVFAKVSAVRVFQDPELKKLITDTDYSIYPYYKEILEESYARYMNSMYDLMNKYFEMGSRIK